MFYVKFSRLLLVLNWLKSIYLTLCKVYLKGILEGFYFNILELTGNWYNKCVCVYRSERINITKILYLCLTVCDSPHTHTHTFLLITPKESFPFPYKCI